MVCLTFYIKYTHGSNMHALVMHACMALLQIYKSHMQENKVLQQETPCYEEVENRRGNISIAMRDNPSYSVPVVK